MARAAVSARTMLEMLEQAMKWLIQVDHPSEARIRMTDSKDCTFPDRFFGRTHTAYPGQTGLCMMQKHAYTTLQTVCDGCVRLAVEA